MTHFHLCATHRLKTAAFKVSCREEFRDLFHDEENWPEGAELRDWVVYRQRDSTA